MNVRDMPPEVMVWFESPALSVPGQADPPVPAVPPVPVPPPVLDVPPVPPRPAEPD